MKLIIYRMFDLFSFMGIVWYVLTRIIMGPISQLIKKDQLNGGLKERIVYDLKSQKVI